MTANPPARRTRARRRRVARTLLAVVAVGAGVLGGAALPAAASPVSAAADPTPTPAAAAQAVTTTLVPDALGAYASGSPLSSTLTIDNTGSTELAAGTVRLELGRTALADRTAVRAWLEADTADAGDAHDVAPPVLAPLGLTDADAVAPQSTSSAIILVPAAEVGELAPGVYPLRATYTAAAADNGGAAVSSTASSVLVVGGSRPAVTTIVPITATPAGPLLTADELTALTGPRGALTTQLDAVTGTGAVLALDPLIPAAIRALGATAPGEATAWLDRLESLPNDRFALQAADADVAAQASAGLDTPLGLDTLDPLLNPQNFSADADQPAPSPSTAPSDVALPTVEQLTRMGAATWGMLWPRGDVSADDLTRLAAYNGEADRPAVTILPSTSFASGAGDAALSGRGEVGDAPVLVTDAAVSDALSRAAGAADPAPRGSALTEAAALLWFADPASPVLAGLDRDEARSGPGLSAAITAFGDARPAALAEALAAEPVALEVSSASAADRAEAVGRLLQDEQRIGEFATILDDPAQLTVRQRISGLRLLAVGANRTPEAFATALQDMHDTTLTTLDAVGLQPSNPILISANVDVPVWLRNDLPYPVHVRLHAEPSDARIDVQSETDVDGQPSGTTQLKVPIESRIASGEVDLEMRLTSLTGIAIGSPQVARLTVRAEWEGIGLNVLGAVAVLLIGGGILRTVLRRRRVASDDDDAQDAEHADNGIDGEVTTEQGPGAAG
ncbi:hypothetical protein GCM10025768_02400 [Microbacterium pseudoresistens]|uniref:2-oxoglutarate dehydrogenase n=1 Tax=Microbacterium pseudoresistens TaxID=640634 RepID=A0A7Y9EU96_9MICO|nr:DUF6049 family protein [Microbacterium pseudoresistens]NYD54074.1 hypothetical protein [Microbacterium pseudoresistens]